ATLMLQLHPRKIYLQHYTKGVVFLGAVIKPYRNYIANRPKANFYQAVRTYNRLVERTSPSPELKKQFVCCMNSYLGIMKHYRTAKLREHIIKEVVSPVWWKHFYANGRFRKVILKKSPTPCPQIPHTLPSPNASFVPFVWKATSTPGPFSLVEKGRIGVAKVLGGI
ncbi:MAG: hypothetical protein WCP32_10550, partial [Bacteroidota bacterium]